MAEWVERRPGATSGPHLVGASIEGEALGDAGREREARAEAGGAGGAKPQEAEGLDRKR